MNIGRAAQLSGVSAKMLRYYESIGLIKAGQRSAAGYRVYSEEDLGTLRFIKNSRSLGFPLERIRNLLSLWQDSHRESADVKALALEHIAELDARIQELRGMRDDLVRLADACRGDHQSDCSILSGLDPQPEL